MTSGLKMTIHSVSIIKATYWSQFNVHFNTSPKLSGQQTLTEVNNRNFAHA